MHREGMSMLTEAQTELASFFIFRATMCKPENSLCNREDNFQIWKRMRRGGPSHFWVNNWHDSMQKQDFSELSLSQSERHQTGPMRANKVMQMCRGLFLLWDTRQTGLRTWQENLPIISHALARSKLADCSLISLSYSLNIWCTSASALYK